MVERHKFQLLKILIYKVNQVYLYYLPIRVADKETEKKSKASKVQPKNAKNGISIKNNEKAACILTSSKSNSLSIC